MGAFRRRIESLLCDPAVARRIARRLNGEQSETAPRRPARGVQGARPQDACAIAREDCPQGSIFGRCDCDGACRLMPFDLKGLLGRSAPPVLVAATRH
ncbi:hypothetical protein [Rhodobaculum claviforme]|uniref:Uncharacterized protein n=1 Tax=Rhodobaculum claviforme TaxID=1549854 RepID=A0A934WI44_9RHOB|nr:hypothetical protein [Rhodobaculum claviforme]MBK5926519.1 hypothetical protein [Rhodobaculum claviforme]